MFASMRVSLIYKTLAYAVFILTYVVAYAIWSH